MRSLYLVLILSLTAAAQTRTWTDDRGRKIEAELVAVDGDNVMLRLNGRDIPWPLENLSPEDQKFVETAQDGLGKKAEPAPVAGPDPEDANFDAPWPERVTFNGDPEILVVEENPEKKRFVYDSANYRYICDARLSKSVVRGFALLFEATHLYARQLPLGMGDGPRKDGKYQILLFEEFESYVRAGGPPSSAGVYMGGQGIVMVPLTSLGVRPVGSGYMLDRDKSSKTLPHELIHQLTPDPYYRPGSMGWFSEGIAEYVAVTHYNRSGSFAVRGNQKPIIEYITAYGKEGNGGRALGTKINMPHLKSFMLQSYSQFTGRANFNYGCGLLITNYFLHMDGNGDAARIKEFLKTLRAGTHGEEALDVLLDGRSWDELHKEISKAWSRRGIDVTFESEESSVPSGYDDE